MKNCYCQLIAQNYFPVCVCVYIYIMSILFVLLGLVFFGCFKMLRFKREI